MRLDRTKAKYTKKDIACQANAKERDGVFRAKILGGPILSLPVSFGLGIGLDGGIFTGVRFSCQVCVHVIE